MIPRSHRLPLKSNTPIVGKHLHHSALTLIQANTQLDHYRLAIIISKKVDSRAVVRHRLKRQTAHAAMPLCLASPPADWLIILRPPAANLEFHQLKTILEQLFTQATTQPDVRN